MKQEIKSGDVIKFERGGRVYKEMIIKITDAGYLVDCFGPKYILLSEIIAVKHRNGLLEVAGIDYSRPHN